MIRHYSSFLIRCWQINEETHRINIEHIQSGETTQVDSLAKLSTWIEQHWKQANGDGVPVQSQILSAEKE